MATLTLHKSIAIEASVKQVWNALTDPELIKEYFFDTETTTDWKKGSPVYFRGVWDGVPYEDKGIILDIEPLKFVTYSYWSSFSGTEDKPENYANITYELQDKGETTVMTVIQEGFKNKEAQEHSEQNWSYVLDSLKKLVEEEQE